MPTKEWMEKYEAVKEKLTCKIDLDAYFTEKKIGKTTVDVLEIGDVSFPTGTESSPFLRLATASSI